jgi:hypothetical protein
MIIRCNTVLVDKKLEALDIGQEPVYCPIYINTESIESIRPALDEDLNKTENSIVVFQSGDEHELDVDFKTLIKTIYLDNGLKIINLNANS